MPKVTDYMVPTYTPPDMKTQMFLGRKKTKKISRMMSA